MYKYKKSTKKNILSKLASITLNISSRANK